VKLIATLVLIAAAHVAFLFGAYGSKFFGLHLPYGVAISLWLGVSTGLAGFGYFKAASRLSANLYGRLVVVLVAASASLYVGEARWVLIRMSASARLLTVVYTLRNENQIRLISARKATRKEVANYA
jgi:hypothetical protein